MSGNDKLEQIIKHKCSKLLEKNNCAYITPQRKTTSKFSTMVPKARGSVIEITQEESQTFHTSDEDFRSTSSHLSVDSEGSGNDLFFNANFCDPQEEISKCESRNRLANENSTSVTTTSTTMKENIKTGSSTVLQPQTTT